MTQERMHENEVLADPDVVRRLLATQMPQWAELSIGSLPLGGTDNDLYRLGDDMIVRLPRIDWAVAAIEREYEWLPKLAPLLPEKIPRPLAMGKPGEGYPWRWSVYEWLDGVDPSIHREIDRDALLPDLVRFIQAMHEISLNGPPRASRGMPLATRDKAARAAIDTLDDSVDRATVLALWKGALGAPAWVSPPLWVHGDLDARNLLVKHGRLNAVIDWGGVGVGDPACDIALAWKVFSPSARETFRRELRVEDATWDRARGWTLLQAVEAIPYYTPRTNPVLLREAQAWLDAVLADNDAPKAV